MEELAPNAQPKSNEQPPARAAKRNARATLDILLLRCAVPKSSRNAGTAIHNHSRGFKIRVLGRVLIAALAAVPRAIVIVVVTGAPRGVTVDGSKLHVPPAGNPVHPNATGAANPSCGVTVIVMVASDPFFI